jgi:pimeloyl-ACP methyl ester carboxylesterase
VVAAGDEVNSTPLPFRHAGAGEPLVLVHGFLGGSAPSAAEIARLNPHDDALAPDLAGQGAAGDRAAPDRIAAHARALLRPALFHTLVLDFLRSPVAAGG